MADHNVTLNYIATGSGVQFVPDRNPITVRPGQTIGFQLGIGPADGKIRITFADPHFFSAANPHFQSTGRFNDGDGEVRVVAVPNHTTYRCELLINGVVRAQSAENAGGDIIPDGAAA